MIRWWRCPSGQTADARCAALSLAARGLLWTLADFADGTGVVPTGALALDVVLRGAAPHDAPALRAAAWKELEDAGLVALNEGALLLHLAAREVAAGDTSMIAQGPLREGAPRAQGGARDRRYLQALSSRYKLTTPEQRAAWAAGDGAAKVVGATEEDLAAWVAAAGRRGGLFGSDRQPARGDNNGDNTLSTTETTLRSDGDNVVTVDGDNNGDNTLSPSHSPSERKTERKRENARSATETTPPRARRQHGDNVVTVDGDNTFNAERIEEALAKRSSGRIDLLSAPALTRFALRSLLGEMGVDLPLAERMGELAANPAEVWPYLKDTSRVTLNFLVGKVDNNGVRAAGPLVELVSRARADLAAGTPAPTPEPPARPRPRAAPMSDADAAESLRIAQEFAARRRATPTQEPTHVP